MGLCESKESANVVERRSDTAENHTDSKVHGGSNVPEEVPNSAKGGKFSEYYTLGKPIGQGTFSVVREAVCIKTGQKYAIKCIKRGGLSAEDIDALTTEVALLKQIKHPNIMILYDFFTEPDYYFLVTEYMEGGELFDRIVDKSYYTEREARDLVLLLLEAIKYCHSYGIVHRDLKPENVLLSSKDDNASIKLADFGFAKKLDLDSENLTTACGTPGYVAPEILKGSSYGKTVDIWSIGVITFILLCGYPPFHHDNHNALFRLIKAGKFEFSSPYWDHISDEAKDLINQMLVVDPAKRATAEELLRHPWVVGTELATVQLTSALDELKRYNARRKFKTAIKTVQAANRLKVGDMTEKSFQSPTSTTAPLIDDTSSSTSTIPASTASTNLPIVHVDEVVQSTPASDGLHAAVHVPKPTESTEASTESTEASTESVAATLKKVDEAVQKAADITASIKTQLSEDTWKDTSKDKKANSEANSEANSDEMNAPIKPLDKATKDNEDISVTEPIKKEAEKTILDGESTMPPPGPITN